MTQQRPLTSQARNTSKIDKNASKDRRSKGQKDKTKNSSFYFIDQTIDRTTFLRIVAHSLQKNPDDIVTFRNCVFDFDIGKLMRDIFVSKSSTVKTFDFKRSIIKKPLSDKDIKFLNEQNILIIK